MEQPLFYQGQRVVAVVSVPPPFVVDDKFPMPIDGKSYYITHPNALVNGGYIFVKIAGFEATQMFWQGLFVGYDTDHALENEIHEALKGQKIIV